MREKKIIYQGNNSGLNGSITEFNLLGASGLSAESLRFSCIAIEFSKRHKADLMISKNERLCAEFFIQVGDFSGGNRELFAALIRLAKDTLILPLSHSDFTLKINMYRDI